MPLRILVIADVQLIRCGINSQYGWDIHQCRLVLTERYRSVDVLVNPFPNKVFEG